MIPTAWSGVQPAPSRDGTLLLDRTVPIVLYTDEWGWADGMDGRGTYDRSYLPSGTAGYVVMLARELRRRGYRVAAICQAVDAIAPMRALLQDCDVVVHTFESRSHPGLGERARNLLTLRSIIRGYPGCVLALLMGYYTSGGAVIIAAASAGAAAIVRADLTGPEPPITWRQRLALKFKDHFVDRIAVGAVDNREAFVTGLGRSGSKIRVIHTGIQLPRFQPGKRRSAMRQLFKFADHSPVVGTIARLGDARKGIAHFLDMAAEVASALPSTTFLIVGDGMLRPHLERRASELGIADRVTFAGWRSDIPAVLEAMDVFVMPSLVEGGPTTVLEAMTMGKPVVATRVGMVPEVIEHEVTGLVVPPGDPHALAENVMLLLREPETRGRLGHRAREKALADFSLERMVDRYLQVFAEAAGAG